MNHSAELPLEKKVRSGRGSLNITFFNWFFLSYPVIKMCLKKECGCLFFQAGENNFEESSWHYKRELEKQFSNQLILIYDIHDSLPAKGAKWDTIFQLDFWFLAQLISNIRNFEGQMTVKTSVWWKDVGKLFEDLQWSFLWWYNYVWKTYDLEVPKFIPPQVLKHFLKILSYHLKFT